MTSGEAHQDFEFRYKADEWKRIAAELPQGAPARRIRREMELNCSVFLITESLPPSRHKHRERRWRSYAKNAGALLKAWPDSERDGGRPCAASPLAPLYEELEAVVAKIQNIAARSRYGRKGPNLVTRNVLVRRLIQIWADARGRVASSTHSETGIASGPLVRFLIAATAPVLKKALSPDAARARIRKFESIRLESRMVK
jgi:hypothetical protein